MISRRIHVLAAATLWLAACGSCGGTDGTEGATTPGETTAPPTVGDDGVRIWNGDPDLPGVARVDRALMRAAEEALEAKGAGYEPRTHHLHEDGSPEYTNRLIFETSPYLLQHAHNPVNWFSWGREAFERAQSEDKPILLSVGYSTCHWCHVMERESFEDEEIARYINEHFIAIKVDREERPDVDDLYMRAVHMLAGRGGWPMTVVMTPQREPFFGGTYFPPRDGARGARRGFLTILRELSARYREDRDEVVAQAQTLSRRLRQQAEPARPAGVPGPEALVNAARQLASRFAPEDGGFGGPPRFPQPSRLSFLLRYHRRTGDPAALEMVEHTLEQMAKGGIHDQVGGGFHRYSTDARWLVPHFEKMLYDNAQLTVVYLEGWQATGNDRFRGVAEGILDYVAREMTSPEGGFYSATDADSPTPEGHYEEGWFFTWTPEELREVLGRDRARAVEAYYGVTPRGNFEGRNILHETRSAEEVAEELSMTVDELERTLEEARRRLYEARAERPPPLRDDKILVAWNGLMISAFARGALAFGREGYARRAERAASMLLSELRDDEGRLQRSHAEGEASHRAYLEDYAFLIAGLLDLYDATSETRWLREALALQEQLDASFADEDRGGYFQTAHDHEELLARLKPADDGAVPSGNSVEILNLLRLAELTGDAAWRRKATEALSAFGLGLRRRPTSAPAMLSALDWYLDVPLEIVLVSPEEGDGSDVEPLLAELRGIFLPNRIIAALPEPRVEDHAALVPVLEGKVAIDDRPTAYVCERGHCELPTHDPDVFAGQIGRVRPLDPDDAPARLALPTPGETPDPWHYDAANDRHWHPGHRHWHQGRPPAR